MICEDYLKEQRGIALVVTLLALVLITAMVVEFSYAVYTGTNDLYNWRDSQRLSIMAKSGINVSVKYLPMALREPKYLTGTMEIPVENPFEDFSGTVTVRIEDEASKFNINSIVFSQGNQINEPAYKSFRQLLHVLSLNEKIADRVVEWIQRKRESGSSPSAESMKYYRLPSVDEILLIDGIGGSDYDKLSAYVTVNGPRDEFAINVNRAGKPVLMSILGPDDESFPITEDTADNIVRRRELSPFDVGSFKDFTGKSFSSDRVTTTGKVFTIKSTASSGGVKRIIETVFNTSTGTIEYWKEY